MFKRIVINILCAFGIGALQGNAIDTWEYLAIVILLCAMILNGEQHNDKPDDNYHIE